MKLLLVLGILALPVFSFAQNQPEKKKEAGDEYYSENYQRTPFTAGTELKKAANRQFIGVAIGLGGIVIGTVIAASDPEGAAGPLLVGSASIASLILNISAWSHVKRAGQMMENNRLSFSGRGLVINLN